MSDQTTVVFGVSELADALSKARRISPLLNSNTGNTAGVFLEIRPSDLDEPISIRATDGEIFWDCWPKPISLEGPDVDWRVPVDRFADLITAMSGDKGETVTLWSEHQGQHVNIDGKRLKAGIPLMTGDTYPVWDPFDDTLVSEVTDLGEKIASVAWAAHKDLIVTPWSGITLTGHQIVATDRFRLAAIPCQLPGMELVTLPISRATQLIKDVGTIRVGVEKGKFMVVPDAISQLRTTTYGRPVPFETVKKVMREDYEHVTAIPKKEFTAAIRRVSAVAAKSQTPGITLTLADEAVEISADGGADGWARESVELPGCCLHDPIEIYVTPAIIADAVSHSPAEGLTINYDAERVDRKPRLHFSAQGGYQSWIPQLTKAR